jgi:hypothetical protein
MKSLERKFIEIEEKNPNLSTYMIFAQAIKNGHFSKDKLARYFNKLVDPDDYVVSEKKALLKLLMIQNK